MTREESRLEVNGCICNQGSTGAGENDGHVIGLFGVADPVRHGAGDNITNAGKWLVAMLLDQFNQMG